MTKHRPGFFVVWLMLSLAIGVFLWRIDSRAGSDPNNKIILSVISLFGGLFAALLYQTVCGLFDLIKGKGTQAAPESITEEPLPIYAVASNVQKSPTKGDANAVVTVKQGATPQQKQRRALKIAALLIIATMLYPPFHLQATGGMVTNFGYAFLFNPPRYNDNIRATVDVALLVAQWIGICLVCGLWWLSCKDKGQPA